MHKGMKIYISNNDDWVDVTNREAIIYGAGQGCLDMLNEFKLPNIRYVIDGDKGKQGVDILIQNKLYNIDSPNLFMHLDLEHYYVVISSIQYRKEIQEEIIRITNGKILSCVWNTDIRYCYEKIEDMFFLDPIINKKLFLFNLSFYTYEILNDFYVIIDEVLGDTKLDRFIPIRQGESKLIFLFGNSESLWVYSVRGISSSTDEIVIKKYEDEFFCQKVCFINKHLHDELTLYNNAKGILVQKYAFEQLDFCNWETRKSVMRECRRIHSIATEGLSSGSFIKSRFELYRNRIRNCEGDDAVILYKIDNIAKESLSTLNSSNNRSLIHGDLIYENIVKYNGNVTFIDWEYLAIGNPMIDVSYFLYSIHFAQYSRKEISFKELCTGCFTELPQLVECYCQNDFRFSDYINDAKAAMRMYLIIAALGTYLGDSAKGVSGMKALLMW